MSAISIIGCGFVADLYMRSLTTFPQVRVVAVFDRDPDRLLAFCMHWGLTPAASLDDLFAATPDSAVILNLTNPASHYELNHACLSAGFHTYSEKPLATDMQHAHALHDLARERGLLLASAPCSVLGEAAQVLAVSVRNGVAGKPRLIYADLDDGFIPQAPFKDWISDSGARWPHVDEFRTGCTLEHAGYYLSWLIAMFGSVRRVVAASAQVLPDLLPPDSAPDVSIATLFFESGPVARLTCSIVAPHDHRIRVIGDLGVLEVKQAWDNSAKVKFHRRMRIRKRLLEHPLGRRMKPAKTTHPKVGRWGAASMNFALGPVEMLDSLRENRPCRLSSIFALHLNEVTLAIQNAGDSDGIKDMQTTCPPMDLMPWAS